MVCGSGYSPQERRFGRYPPLPGRDGRAAPVTVTIGKLSEVDLKMATSKAKKLVGKIADGVDPLAEKREEQRRERAVVGKAIKEYEKWLRVAA